MGEPISIILMEKEVGSPKLLFENLYCGGGTRNSLLEVRVEDVIRLNDAVVSDITKKE